MVDGGGIDRWGRRDCADVFRPQVVAVHRGLAAAHRRRGLDRPAVCRRRDRTARPARLVAGAGLPGRGSRRPDPPHRRRGGGDAGARRARILAHHGGAPHRRLGAAPDPCAPLRSDRRTRPRPVRGATLGRSAARRDRRRGTTGDLFRPVPAAALRRRGHALRHLCLRRLSRPAARRGAARLCPAHARRPGGVPPLGSAIGEGAAGGLCGLRRRAARFGTGVGDAQGLRPKRRTRALPRRESPRPLPHHDVGAGEQLGLARHHRCRHRGWRGSGARRGCGPRRRGRHRHRGAAHRADDGRRGLPAHARPESAPAHRHARSLGGGEPVPPARHQARHRRRGRRGRHRRAYTRRSPSRTCISPIRAAGAPRTTASPSP